MRPPALAVRLLATLIAAATAGAHAVPLDLDAAGAAVDAVQDARDLRKEPGAKPAEQAGLTGTWNVGLGLAAIHDEQDREIVSTPASLSWQSPGEWWWKWQVRPEGYTWIDNANGARREGLGDTAFTVIHKVATGVAVSAAVVVPGRGAVGVDTWAETGRLLLGGTLGPRANWFALAGLRHQQQGGTDSRDWTPFGYGQLTWQANPDYRVGAGLSLGNPGGRGTNTELALVSSFKVGGATRGDLALTRSLGDRTPRTGLRINLSRDF